MERNTDFFSSSYCQSWATGDIQRNVLKVKSNCVFLFFVAMLCTKSQRVGQTAEDDAQMDVQAKQCGDWGHSG